MRTGPRPRRPRPVSRKTVAEPSGLHFHSKTVSNTIDGANRPTPDSAGKGQAEGGADEEIVDVLVCVRRSVFRAEAARDSEQLGVVEVGECVEVLEQCLLPLFPQVRSPKPQPNTRFALATFDLGQTDLGTTRFCSLTSDWPLGSGGC